jgi:hypothetical protein
MIKCFNLMFDGTRDCKVLSGVKFAWKVPP